MCAEYFDEIDILSVRNGLVNLKPLRIFEKCELIQTDVFWLFIYRLRSIHAMKWPF